MSKHHITKVVSIQEINKDIFRIRLQLETFPKIVPGQFLNVKVTGFSLRRPFAICDWDEKKKTVDFGFILRGEGTIALSKVKVGDTLDVLLPLGNGFADTYTTNSKVMLVGGGVGVFPLLSVAKNHPNCYSLLGYRNNDTICLVDEFKQHSKEVITNIGGFITDDVKREIGRIKPDVVLCCGPDALMKALGKSLREGTNVPIYVSLEQRMACGFGACLCCNQQVKVKDEIENLRVCCEGPVFKLEDVVWH